MTERAILDPKDLAGDDYDTINEKLRVSNMVIARPPDKGGSPFIYAFSSTKNHYLEDIKLPIYTDEEGNEEYFYTAGTDGKRYLWHPEMIKRLNPVEMSIVLAHETYHIVLQHTDPHRVFGKKRKLWAIAIDYVVNSMIEHDYRQTGRISDYSYKGQEHPIWKGGLGQPLYFDELIAKIKEEAKQVKQLKQQMQKGQLPQNSNNKQKKPDLKDIKIYADYAMYGKGAEEIYDMLLEETKEMDDDILDMVLQMLGGQPMDDHDEVEIPRPQLLQEIMDAVTATKQLAGTVPASIQDQLLKLSDPKLTWQDIVRIALQAKRQQKGQINDWSRFRRRNVSFGIYSPRKKDQYVKWLAGLDTSGSMSPEDMTYGVSQLKCLDGRSEGIVVPWDAQVYWDKAVKIQSMSDLPKVNPVGRGGTCVLPFFENWKKEVGTEFDLIIIMTDGGIFDLNNLPHPGVDVVWVLTNEYERFNPPFGRVAPMRRF